MSTEIQFSSYGLKQKQPGFLFESASHGNLHISVVMSGKVHIQTPHLNRTATPGMLMCIKPGETVKLFSPIEGYTGVHCALKPSTYGLEVPTLVSRAGEKLFYTAGLILKELTNITPDKISIVPALFELYALQALRRTSDLSDLKKNFTPEYWAEKIKERIDNLIYTPTSIDAVLESFPLSSRQLLRHFSYQTGNSVKNYQIERRIEEAKKLLAESSLSITAIAFELHFPSSQHFSTQFKTITGMTPKEFRRKNDV